MQKGQTHAVGYAVCSSMQYTVGMQYVVGTQYAVDTQYTVCSRYAVRSRYTVRSRYAVCSRCWCKKVNSHSVLSKYGWWGPLPLVQKGQTPCNEDTVCSRCCCKKVSSHSVLFAPTPTAYCIPHVWGLTFLD